jgi:hypothetical protein
MKGFHYLPKLIGVVFMVIASSCDGLIISPFDNEKSEEEKTVTEKQAEKEQPGYSDTPEELVIGKAGNYAFPPDSMIDGVPLGNADSLESYFSQHGNNFVNVGNDIMVSYFTNRRQSEHFRIYSKRLNDRQIPFKLEVISSKDSPVKSKAVENFITVPNIFTGYRIHIGHEPYEVKNIYQQQSVRQWLKNDTLTVEYQPKEKDAERYPKYGRKSYKATYKFYNDRLRYVSYSFDPKEIQ